MLLITTHYSHTHSLQYLDPKHQETTCVIYISIEGLRVRKNHQHKFSMNSFCVIGWRAFFKLPSLSQLLAKAWRQGVM